MAEDKYKDITPLHLPTQLSSSESEASDSDDDESPPLTDRTDDSSDEEHSDDEEDDGDDDDSVPDLAPRDDDSDDEEEEPLRISHKDDDSVKDGKYDEDIHDENEAKEGEDDEEVEVEFQWEEDVKVNKKKTTPSGQPIEKVNGSYGHILPKTFWWGPEGKKKYEYISNLYRGGPNRSLRCVCHRGGECPARLQLKLDLDRGKIIHIHRGEHSEKCNGRNQVNHLFELDLEEEGTGIEEFQSRFKQRVKDLTISNPVLTANEIWNKVRAEMVTEAKLGAMCPDS
eukprot:scaffold64961_cov46-Cyclotella_meneghiniana.AAC.2